MKHLTIKIIGGELRGIEIETTARETTDTVEAAVRAVHRERKRLNPGERLERWWVVPQAYPEPTYYLGRWMPRNDAWTVDATIRVHME